MLRQAMIFAAGFGTRLQPLTNTIPKALVPVGGKPMLQHTIEQLKAQGITSVIINIHYLGEKILDFLDQHKNFGIDIQISDERERILETGGGLLKAKEFINEDDFLVCNADVFTNINIQQFAEYHFKHKAVATLAVRVRKSSRVLLFDATMQLCGWRNFKNEEIKYPLVLGDSAAHYYDDNNPVFDDEKYATIKNSQAFAFSGYQVISKEIFNHKTREGIFSMTDWYLDICAAQKIIGYDHSLDIWIDIGSPEQLERANVIVRIV